MYCISCVTESRTGSYNNRVAQRDVHYILYTPLLFGHGGIFTNAYHEYPRSVLSPYGRRFGRLQSEQRRCTPGNRLSASALVTQHPKPLGDRQLIFLSIGNLSVSCDPQSDGVDVFTVLVDNRDRPPSALGKLYSSLSQVICRLFT